VTLRTDVAELGMRHYLFFSGQLDSLDDRELLSRYASTNISGATTPRMGPSPGLSSRRASQPAAA
jgi:hypothetical protein